MILSNPDLLTPEFGLLRIDVYSLKIDLNSVIEVERKRFSMKEGKRPH